MNTSLLYGPLQLLQKKVSNYRMYLGLNEENIIRYETEETDPKINSYVVLNYLST